MTAAARLRVLTAVLRCAAVVLILRVLAAILANYPDYFPPNFDALFLQGRERTFTGSYAIAFYTHIVSGPVVLVTGLILMSERVRWRFPRFHRVLGWVHAVVLLGVMLPSGVVMARHAFAGWSAGLSFLTLSAATAGCTVAGVWHAVRRRYARHRRWMLRMFILVCSAVFLRLISGASELAGVSSPETAYVVAAWASWVVPMATFEALTRRHTLARFHAPPAKRMR